MIELPDITPTAMFEVLVEKMARIAELERQRDEVLALLDETELNDDAISTLSGDLYWSVKTRDVRAIYKPVLLDVSRDPQQHPRDESGRYVQGGEQ